MPSRAEYRTRSQPRKPSLARRMILMLVLVGILLFLLIGWNVMGQIMMKKAMSGMGAPPQTVTSITAEYSEWRPSQDAIGTLRAVRGADLAFDVSGIVARVAIESGDEVDEGDLLVELSAADDLAELRRLEADAALARITFDRAQRQLEANAISKAEFDRSAADLEARQAAVAKQKAVVGKKRLRAPFDGRAGIVTVSPGAFLSAGTPVVTVQQLDPVYADFFVPQGQLGELETGQTVSLTLDAFPDREFVGELSAIDPKVDAGTRNVRVEATVPNPERLLVPGMFANVSVELGEHQRYLTVPQTAVTFNPYGETVFVVVPSEGKGADGKPKLPTAQQVFVTTGPRRGDQVAILTGIDEDTEIVTSGQLKLKNGTPLVIDNTQAPPNDPHPTPQEK